MANDPGASSDSSREVGDRLDSWKEIAAYLKRDVRTAQRWEKQAGLPVYRLSDGKPGGVYASKIALDGWLARRRTTRGGEWLQWAGHRRAWVAWTGAAALALTLSGLTWGVVSARLTAEDLRIHVTGEDVVAFDLKGRPRWRFPFPASHKTALSPVADAVRVVGGPNPAIHVAVAHRIRRLDDVVESGELIALDIRGKRQRSFSFADEVVVNGKKFGPPWTVDAFAVDERNGRRRIAVSGHHYFWAPSLVTLLDDQWRRVGTFVHAGWIENMYWLGADRLLIGGFSNPHQGGMVALLDPGALDGQGPEPAGTEHYCESCGKGAPLKMVIMRRSEVNRVSGAPFNRTIVQVMPERIIAHTIEVPTTGREAVDSLYEFNASLDLIDASFSDRYWEVHRTLEQEGKLDHTRQHCPDRGGPRVIQVWDPAIGWKTQAVRH